MIKVHIGSEEMYKNQIKNVDLQLSLERLSEKNQELISSFLFTKSESSHKNYLSIIIRTFELFNNKEAEDFTIDDYDIALLNVENQKTNTFYVKAFFHYVQENCSLKENERFVDRFYSEKKKPRTPKLKANSQANSDNYIPVLTFEQIQKLQDFLAIDFEDDISKLKSSFACYMLFCTDCQKEELSRVIKATDYYDGKIVTSSGKEYAIPIKYEPVFERKKELKNTGFNNLYDYLKPVEALLQIDKLLPQVLINARNQNTMACSSCGKEYINLSNNWVSVGERIVCRNCGEDLKKNDNYSVIDIQEVSIERVTLADEVEKAAFVFGYDILKQKILNKQIDFNALNEFKDLIGKLGEAYVYKKEKEKLNGTKYFDMVDETPAMYPHMGYDIKSYTTNGEEIFIEVKTESKEKHNDFYISEHEKKIGESLIKQGKKYYIYRVHNILSENEENVRLEIIKDIFTNLEYKFEVYTWKVSEKADTIE